MPVDVMVHSLSSPAWKGAGHVDDRVVRQTLPDTLVWLWRGYPIE